MKLPEGLAVCSECGGIRGTEVTLTPAGVELGATSVCLCDGIVCHHCGEGRVRRPVSDWYDPEKPGWWHTPHFGWMRQCASCGGPSVPDYRGNGDVMPEPPTYRVLVDDNFRYGRADERYEAGSFHRFEDAIVKARGIVEECLEEQLKPGMTADQLYEAYTMFGEDPWITETPEQAENFSAREYARERSRALCPAEPIDTDSVDATGAGG